ncbi:MAG: FKBP-type peptidyl-prolyl cis-trans isomerase [Prevotella sp.]|jgi:FKBP-type peptidyl-prolyl cis-trans isomerase FklB|nr:FKBP-type peptidyl-prolyl cis-trans isomerase [Prevotella sp.]MBR4191142.1 FKBP-type peptidyl-prolyl cis-trans isomerase [Prevotella sp.]
MRKVMILALALVASASLYTADAASKKKTKKQEAPVVVPVQLNNSSDTLSYVAGMSVTNGLIPYLVQQQGVDTAYMAEFIKGFKEVVNAGTDPKMKAYVAGLEIATQVRDRMLPGMKREFTDTPDSIVDALVFRGFSDALLNDTSLFKQAVAEELFKTLQQTNKDAKVEKLWGANRDAGKKFLAENAKKEGVVTLPSGLQYKVLVKGEGDVPQVSEKVFVNYEGRLVDGTVFDASAKHGDKPSEFRPNQVIKGWTEALTMMPVGSKWQLYIPYELAYGEKEAGNIKPFSALIFDVELVGIDRPKPETPEVDKKPAKKAKKTKK